MQTVNEFDHICSMVIQNSCIPFIAFYPEGRIMTCNPAFYSLTGYSGKELEVLENSSRLIDNVRKIQKLKEETLHLKAVELRPVLECVIAQYASVPGRDVLIHFTPIIECSVMADDLITDVFSNIVGNAIKHSAGHLTIDIRMVRSMTNGKGWYKVSIEDDGPGIPDRPKEKIFNRVDKSTMKPNGRGLGLYLVKLLVENYNGRVWVEDRIRGDPTKGCRFVVMLTVVKD